MWFVNLDIIVTGLFVVELLMNVFANSNDGFKPFYTRRSNWLDVFIVVVSVANIIASLSDVELPNAKLLRLIRMGRVIRLFKSFTSLQNLLAACASAMLPVGNTFFILLMIAAVYAIVGTNFFSQILPQYFGSFSASLYTMFEVLMGNMGLARMMAEATEDSEGESSHLGPPFHVALFFVSFILIAGVMMLNIVVAVMCDELMQHVERRRQHEEDLRFAEQERRKLKGCLDPLTLSLITFKDQSDLADKIDRLYEQLDQDNSGGLSYEEFQQVHVAEPDCVRRVRMVPGKYSSNFPLTLVVKINRSCVVRHF
jgi:voltage-gated sodium channel